MGEIRGVILERGGEMKGQGSEFNCDADLFWGGRRGERGERGEGKGVERGGGGERREG